MMKDEEENKQLGINVVVHEVDKNEDNRKRNWSSKMSSITFWWDLKEGEDTGRIIDVTVIE